MQFLIGMDTPTARMILESSSNSEFDSIEQNSALTEKYYKGEVEFFEYWNTVHSFYVDSYRYHNERSGYYFLKTNEMRNALGNLDRKLAILTLICLPLNIFAAIFVARLIDGDGNV